MELGPDPVLSIEKIADRDPDKRFLIIYDGFCPFCRASVHFLEMIDFLEKYSYITLQEFSRTAGTIPLEILEESIHVYDRNTRGIYRSMAAVSRLVRTSPPALPLFLLIQLLRVLGIADHIYNWIAVSRYGLLGRFGHRV